VLVFNVKTEERN